MNFVNALKDTIFGGGKAQAAEREMAAYDRANQFYEPYRAGGLEDYNRYRDVIHDQGNELEGYGNPYDWMWQQASKDPQEFLRQLMSGYNETPESKFAQEQAVKASTQGAAASGMLGSGALLKDLQRNAYDIASRDQQRYLENVLTANNRQMQYGNNLQGERQNYRSGLTSLANLGLGASSSMAQNEIGRAQAQGRADMGNAEGWQNLIATGLSFLPGGQGFDFARNMKNNLNSRI